MNAIYISIAASAILLQLFLPKRYAFIPLITAGCHLGAIEILPELTTARIVILIGILRAYKDNHLHFSIRSKPDTIISFFCLYLILSGIGHSTSEFMPKPIIYRIGFSLNVLGAYIYGRSYIDEIDSVRHYAISIAVVLIPLAAAMFIQQSTGQNPYGYIGATGFHTISRNGELRAAGPFTHPILAGCCGATAIPLAIFLLKHSHKLFAIILLLSAGTIVISCNSSGPLAAVGVSIAAIPSWKYRQKIPALLLIGAILLTINEASHGSGPWHFISHLDFTGGSTGYYRSMLISAAIEHFNEWWFIGTDYTRHWMFSGVSATPDHADLVNYYIHLGVLGGAPCTFLFTWLLWIAIKRAYSFSLLGPAVSDKTKYCLWTVALVLVTHAISLISISYFDQMYIFLYLFIGASISLSTPTPRMTEESKSTQ